MRGYTYLFLEYGATLLWGYSRIWAHTYLFLEYLSPLPFVFILVCHPTLFRFYNFLKFIKTSFFELKNQAVFINFKVHNQRTWDPYMLISDPTLSNFWNIVTLYSYSDTSLYWDSRVMYISLFNMMIIREVSNSSLFYGFSQK